MTAQPPTTPPRVARVGIVAKTRLPDAPAVVSAIVEWLSARHVATILETKTAAGAGRPTDRAVPLEALPARSDLVLVLGGDGTLLGVSREIVAGEHDVPVLAVNFGSLGFLTEITLPELYPALESVLSGRAGLDRRQMLEAVVTRADGTRETRVALNDVVLSKAALSNIIELTVTVGDQLVTRLRADGLIVASPTGSTAYSLAAGGPIVHPTVDAIVLTPIAPHTLTHRPIVLPATVTVGVTPDLEAPYRSAYVSFDGQSGSELGEGDQVTIRRARRPLRMVRAEARSYFAVLREKLRWGSGTP